MTKEIFFDQTNNWCNHRYLLWAALENTNHIPLPVLELGCGWGSTPLIRDYCKDKGRDFVCYDYSYDWALKFGGIPVSNWDEMDLWRKEYSICLLDLSPGEYRKVALPKIRAKVIIVHDSEPAGHTQADYRVRPLFKRFRYARDYKTTGAWTTALSNEIDVFKWDIS